MNCSLLLLRLQAPATASPSRAGSASAPASAAAAAAAASSATQMSLAYTREATRQGWMNEMDGRPGMRRGMSKVKKHVWLVGRSARGSAAGRQTRAGPQKPASQWSHLPKSRRRRAKCGVWSAEWDCRRPGPWRQRWAPEPRVTCETLSLPSPLSLSSLLVPRTGHWWRGVGNVSLFLLRGMGNSRLIWIFELQERGTTRLNCPTPCLTPLHHHHLPAPPATTGYPAWLVDGYVVS